MQKIHNSEQLSNQLQCRIPLAQTDNEPDFFHNEHHMMELFLSTIHHFLHVAKQWYIREHINLTSFSYHLALGFRSMDASN